MSEKDSCNSVGIGERKRLIAVSLVLFFFFGLLLIRFYYIQISEGEKWSRLANSQHYTVVSEPARRGLFYANSSRRSGHPQPPQPLVIDVPKFHLYIDPIAIPPNQRQVISGKLTEVLRLKPEAAIRLQAQFEKKSRSRKLVMWIDRNKYEEILSWWRGFAKQKKIARNALFFVQDWKRSYPYGKLLGQILHTVRDDRDEKTDQVIPTGGLETIFHKQLSGTPGKRQIMRSPRHPLDTGVLLKAPQHGADVHLTVDHYLQAVAEEEIAKAVQKAGAKNGWAMMMDPYTGEILALAQYPWFKPASYRQFFNDPILREYTKVKAVTDPYEPGSIIKPFTLAIGLLANTELQKKGKKPIFSVEEKIPTTARSFPGRSKPLKDLHSYRYLNMHMGLQKSSNVYMGTVVQRVIEHLGADWYRTCLHDICGFGVKTGIELPGESAGLLPKPGKLHPNGTLEWSSPTPYSLAMGHNLLATSMQMLRLYGILANGGFAVNPMLVSKVVRREDDGTEIVIADYLADQKKRTAKQLFPPEVVREIIKAMKYATKPGGTSVRADIYGYTEVGKTGTSEKVINGKYSKKDHISTFVGFVPASKPCFVLLIAIDDPEYKYIPGSGRNQQGGLCCAPAFREIATRALQYLGVEPDDPHGYPPGDPRYDPEKADWIKETHALKELFQQWNH